MSFSANSVICIISQFVLIDSFHYYGLIFLLFVCLVILDWIFDIVNFVLLGNRFFHQHLQTFMFYSEV
jgi:hypothetical protein